MNVFNMCADISELPLKLSACVKIAKKISDRTWKDSLASLYLTATYHLSNLLFTDMKQCSLATTVHLLCSSHGIHWILSDYQEHQIFCIKPSILAFVLCNSTSSALAHLLDFYKSYSRVLYL